MILSGRVVEVSSVPIGEVLTADHAAGATVLTVNSTVDFEGVSQVSLVNDIGTTFILGLLFVDDEAETLTLASPLPEAFEADSFVAAYPLGSQVEAQVLVEDGEEALSARVPHTLIDRLAEGVRAEGEQEAVEVNDEGGEWAISDVFGVVPKVDGAFIDPATLPPPTPPYVPPALTAPTVAPVIDLVVGLPTSLLVVVDPVRPEDEIEYHLSTDPDFVPVAGDAATIAIPRTRSTVVTIATLPVTDALLDPKATYYVRAFARNAAGSGPVSAVKMGALDLTGIDAVVAAKLIVGFILAGQITVGGITINPNTGITIMQPGGGVIRFPSNGTDFAEITAHLVAKTLAVEGNMTLAGATQVLGSLILANGVVAPRTAPILSSFWPSYAVPSSAYAGGDTSYGLANYHSQDPAAPAGTIDPTFLVSMVSTPTARIRLIRRQVGVAGSTPGEINETSVPGGWGSLAPVGGITLIGDSYYVLGYDTARSNVWYIYRLNRDFAKVSEATFVTSFGLIAGRPAIGRNEAGELLLAYTPASGVAPRYLFVQRRSTANLGAAVATYSVANTANMPGGVTPTAGLLLTSVEEGRFDLGSTATPRYYFGVGGAKNVAAYTQVSGSLVPDRGRDFGTAGVTPKGVVFDKADPLLGLGRFTSLDSSGNVHRYSSFSAVAAATATSTFVDLDSGGTGQHETAPSPAAASFTIPARAWLRVTAAPAPDAADLDDTKLDRANRVRVYASIAAGTRVLQSSLPVDVRTADLDVIAAGAAAPAIATDFSAAGFLPGVFASTATRAASTKPATLLDGSGFARIDFLIPPGMIVPWVGAAAPAGTAWLLANGQTFIESDHPELALVLGTSFVVSGVAPSRVYRTPDCRGRFLFGATTGYALHAQGGVDTVTMPDHSHFPGTLSAGSDGGHSHGLAAGTTAVVGVGTGGGQRMTGAGNTGSAGAHTHTMIPTTRTGVVDGNPSMTNIPPYAVVNYIVKT